MCADGMGLSSCIRCTKDDPEVWSSSSTSPGPGVPHHSWAEEGLTGKDGLAHPRKRESGPCFLMGLTVTAGDTTDSCYRGENIQRRRAAAWGWEFLK